MIKRAQTFTVALVGADGAGKTTVARRLERDGLLPVKYLYMGVSRNSSNRMLPTSWLLWRLKKVVGRGQEEGGPPDPTRQRNGSTKGAKRLLGSLKAILRVANLVAEEWFRQLLAVYYQWRGYIVLFDRHFYLDYYAHDIAPGAQRPLSLSRRVHGFLLDHLYPKPHLVVLLDAPAEVLFQRKPEGTVELLERRRQEYWHLRDRLPHFATVDATQPEEAVVEEVVALIQSFLAGNIHERGVVPE